MARRVTGREADERLLEWLRLRREGLPIAVISERLGGSRGQILRDMKAVRDADAVESGEDLGDAYSW